jgi:hypothetical protein
VLAPPREDNRRRAVQARVVAVRMRRADAS